MTKRRSSEILGYERNEDSKFLVGNFQEMRTNFFRSDIYSFLRSCKLSLKYALKYGDIIMFKYYRRLGPMLFVFSLILYLLLYVII